MRSLCDRETPAGEVPYLGMNLAAACCRRILALVFPRTSSAASPLAAMSLTAELPESRRFGCVSNGPKSGAGFPVLNATGKSYFCKRGFAITGLQLFQRAWVFLTVKIPLQSRPERWFGWCRAPEQGHARAEFHFVGGAEHLVCGPPGNRVDRCSADPQALAEDRMLQVGPRLIEVADRIALRHRAEPESGDLREDEPHPVAALVACFQLLQGLRVSGALSVHEPCEIEGIEGIGHGTATFQAGARSLPWQRPPRCQSGP